MSTDYNLRKPARSWSRRAFLGAGALGVGSAAFTAFGCGARGNAGTGTGAGATGTPASPPYKITTSWTGIAQESALYGAIDRGIFKKNGLDVNLIQSPGTTGVQALLSGQIQVVGSGGGEALASMAQGSDIIVLIVQTPVFTGKLYAPPAIKSVADLKGKKVGISLPGGTSDQTLRLALVKSGLQPDKDVTFISTGSIQNQVAALLSGAIQGTNVTPGPASVQLEAQGIKPIADFATMGLPRAAIVCISMQRSFIAAHPDVVQKYVDSIVEGTVLFKKDRELGLKELSTILKSDDQAGLKASYDYTAQDEIMPSAPVPDPELFKPFQDVLCNSRGIQAVCNADPSKLVDTSFVQRAVSRGLAK